MGSGGQGGGQITILTSTFSSYPFRSAHKQCEEEEEGSRGGDHWKFERVDDRKKIPKMGKCGKKIAFCSANRLGAPI